MTYENEHWAIRVNDELYHVGTESAFDEDQPCQVPLAGDTVGGGQCDSCGASDGFQVRASRFAARCSACGWQFRFVMAHEDAMEW